LSDLAGFRSRDYKLISARLQDGSGFNRIYANKKTGFKNPVPDLASFWGGKKSNRRTGTGVSNLKIGITTASCSYPSFSYYF